MTLPSSLPRKLGWSPGDLRCANAVDPPLWGRAREGGRALPFRLSARNAKSGRSVRPPTPARPHKGGGGAGGPADSSKLQQDSPAPPPRPSPPLRSRLRLARRRGGDFRWGTRRSPPPSVGDDERGERRNVGGNVGQLVRQAETLQMDADRVGEAEQDAGRGGIEGVVAPEHHRDDRDPAAPGAHVLGKDADGAERELRAGEAGKRAGE